MNKNKKQKNPIIFFIYLFSSLIHKIGSGKSSLLNRLRGIDDLQKESAKVGIYQTTRSISVYSWLRHLGLLFYDLPGIGTDLFPSENYCKQHELEQSDFVIIVSNSRFTNDTHVIVNYCEEYSIPYCLLRTFVDVDVKNEKDRFKSEDQVLQKIWNECLEEFPSMTREKLFLISCRQKYFIKWDFLRFQDYLLNSLPKELLSLFQKKSLFNRSIVSKVCFISIFIFFFDLDNHLTQTIFFLI